MPGGRTPKPFPQQGGADQMLPSLLPKPQEWGKECWSLQSEHSPVLEVQQGQSLLGLTLHLFGPLPNPRLQLLYGHGKALCTHSGALSCAYTCPSIAAS